MTRKMDKTATLALIAVSALLIAAPMVMSYKAEAASQVTGSGAATFPDERVECPNGSVIAEATIEFTATETNNGEMSGTWTITSIDPSVGVKSGTFSGGSIDTNSYTLTGTEEVDEACSQFGGGVVPNPMEISGQCGTGVTINFEAERIPHPFDIWIPERGTFTGDVTCISDPSPPQPPLTERFRNQGQCVAYANQNPDNTEGVTKEACKTAFQNRSNR